MNKFMILLLFLTKIATNALPLEKSEEKLINSLFNDYNKNRRGDTPVYVYLRIKIRQIVDIDQRNEVITTNLHISQAWFDERLKWNRVDFDNLTTIVVPVSQIWFPDTFILNTAESRGYLNITNQSFASVAFSGKVYLETSAQIRTRCKIDLKYFPFDTQKCSIYLNTWVNSINRAGLTSYGSFLDFSEYVNNSLWDLSKYSLSDYFYTPGTHVDRVPATVVEIQFYLKRKPLYYMTNGILQSFLFNLVTLISYWLPLTPQVSISKLLF